MGVLFWILFVVAAILVAFKLYVKLTTGWCRSNVCLVGKTAIITGANAGIGYETAEDFAKRGAKVILACRDPSRGQRAAEQIIEATDNKNVVYKNLDLSSLKSVREFAADINKTEERLDILVNNAGILGPADAKDENGFLVVMQTNYFGHFLLTNLLLDLIKKTPKSRIVNVSAVAAKQIKNLDVKHLNRYPEGEKFVNIKIYSRSKLCNILFTIESAERLKGTGVTTYSLHPGVILTEIFKTSSPLLKFFAETIIKLFMKNSLEGAQTTIYCSVQKGIEIYTGEHFEDCHFVSKYNNAEDPDLPKLLWKTTEDLLKKLKN